ncbi:MAG: M48 family metallopeptidase [Ignavibacteria bacterium]|nr:M48 family metallopeptidase [Ignavibacteria bacterium]
MKSFPFFKKTLFFLFLVLFFNSCKDGINIFSPQDDVKLGTQLHQEIGNNSKEYPILNNLSVKNYVQNILNKIINSPSIKFRNTFKYELTIINDDKTINAFATPGGYIYVYTGLLKFIDNEATLAGILAHEVAHAECRHATERLTKAYGVSILLNLILGEEPSLLAEIAANLFTGLAFLKNSRDDEYEADSYAYEYLKSTEWYPGALIYFFEKVKQNEGNSFLAVLLSTHPLSKDRIDKLNERIKKDNLPQPNEKNLFSERYQNFKKTLP